MLAYRVLLTLAALPIAVFLGLRVLRRRETLADLAERLGRGSAQRDGRAAQIWLHGASNGELTSARSFVDTLLAQAPDMTLVVTTNSVTGRDMVRDWKVNRVQARLAPLDFRLCQRAFLNRFSPARLVILEGDLWPNRVGCAAARGIPTALVSARISEKSARQWSRVPQLSRRMLGHVSLLSAQDAASQSRFAELGVARHAIIPPLSLKASVTLPGPDPEELAQSRACFTRGDTVLAASTHDGEEDLVIAAFIAARAQRPALRMILAPRHPSRSEEVAALLRDTGLLFRTRSKAEPPVRDMDVYLADTLGEMPLWYTLAGMCFVGGSLVSKGGHTPFEPAQFDCAILHGPDVRNFAAPYAALADTGGAIAVSSAETLAQALAQLDGTAQDRLRHGARQALRSSDTIPLEALAHRVLTCGGRASAAAHKIDV